MVESRRLHQVKSHLESWHAITDGLQLADPRVDDRGYRAGDLIALYAIGFDGEYVENLLPTYAEITHVKPGGQGYGIPHGWVLLSLARLQRLPAPVRYQLTFPVALADWRPGRRQGVGG